MKNQPLPSVPGGTVFCQQSMRAIKRYAFSHCITPLFFAVSKITRFIFLSTVCIFFTLQAAAQPVAQFSSSIVNGCAPILVNFVDASAGNPTEWKWDLGNGTISNLQNPSVTYFSPGVYTVKLVIKAGNNKDSIIKTNYITVFSSPLANFTANQTVGCSPFTVNFTDVSNANGGSLTAWQWDFGDGTLAAQQHPTHVYTQSGNFNVTLKITNANGCLATLRKSGYIKNNIASASFLSRVSATCTPQKIIFTNTSSSNASFTTLWDFGDGQQSTLASPTHIYATGGNYSVKLKVTSLQGCKDSATRNFQVTNAVSAAFMADVLTHCKPNVPVIFTNQILANNTYLWDFGDSTISTASNPTHLFENAGVYNIKLVVKNSNGCVDSLIKNAYIKIQNPLFTFTQLPDSSCQPFTKTFGVTTDTNTTITSYLWNLGDGIISSNPSPVRTFTTLGYHAVSLIAAGANGCRDTAFLPTAIKVSTKPVANFTANITNGCANTPVVFNNLSTGATAWFWDFGDFSTSDVEHPSHSYKDTGWMTVMLVAINGGCTDTIFFQNHIYIKPAVAKFTISSNCATPYVRRFLNFSIGASRYLWSFGDSTTSTLAEPVHTFPRVGEYLVNLKVWNDSTGCSFSLSKKVKIIDVEPSFFASDTVICKGESIVFTSGQGLPDVTRFFWDFGDGTSANSRTNTVGHVYKLPGVYSVRLVTLNSLNCTDTILKSLYIKVNGPKAKFGLSAPAICFNTGIVLRDSSTVTADNPIAKWIWKYGDGIVDTLTAPPFQHVYRAPGNFIIILKLIDSKGCTDTFKFPQPLRVNKVSARFTTTDTLACANYPVKFICNYSATGVQYRWDFGDGTGSSLQSPIHRYTSNGLYTIKLHVIDGIGCADSSTIINMVRIVQTTARFDMSDSFRTCPPLLVEFTNQSTNGVDEYWDFGDSSATNTHNPSHFYTYPGVYTATLFVNGPGGCVSVMSRQIIVKGPRGNIAYGPLRLCRPYNVNFNVRYQDAVSFIWDFNDGTTLANTDSVAIHPYQDSGSFVPKIILIDEIGCRVPITGRDTIHNLYAKAAFSFGDSMVCSQSNVSFFNTTSTNDAQVSYLWDFGDGNRSILKNPIHQYASAGIFYPSLTATTSFGCVGYYKTVVPIRVALSPNINIVSSGNGCVPLTTNFSAIITGDVPSGIQWQWSLANGDTSLLQNPPPQLYQTPGIYTIQLTATSNIGCVKNISTTIEAFALPNLQVATDTFLCKGQSISLQSGGAAKYSWTPASSLHCDTCQTVIASPLVSTQYYVTGTSLQGCKSNGIIALDVKQPHKITYSPAATLCAGQSKRLQANGASTYQWSPAVGLSSTVSAAPLAQPFATTKYMVIGKDDKSCFADTGYVSLTVYNTPTVDAGADKTINAGKAVDLHAICSPDVTEIEWLPTDGFFRNGVNPVTVKPSSNTEYTVSVKNRGGCIAKDRVSVFVICNGNNVFMPNLFSPNNDGVNDVFYPRGTGLFKVKTLRIFNRWGEAVFEKSSFNSNDPSAGWDGTFKGTMLNADVFIYTLELICDNSSVFAMNGNISLVR